jgi:hypothetical protein
MSLIRGPWSTKSSAEGTIIVDEKHRTTKWEGWQSESVRSDNCFTTALDDNNNEQFCVLAEELALALNTHLRAVIALE